MFNSPMGICFLPVGKFIVVSDSGNRRIQVFDKDGKFVTKMGASGSLEGYFDSLYGVAYNPVTKQLIVADQGNNRLQLFSAEEVTKK